MELHHRIVTHGTQIGFKGTFGHDIVQGLKFYLFVVILALFVKG